MDTIEESLETMPKIFTTRERAQQLFFNETENYIKPRQLFDGKTQYLFKKLLRLSASDYKIGKCISRANQIEDVFVQLDWKAGFTLHAPGKKRSSGGRGDWSIIK